MKIAASLKDKIGKFPDGFVFTYNDLDIVPDKESAYKITIYRLVKAGIVERLAKGRFYKPMKGIVGKLRPDENEIVKDLLLENGKPIGYITGLGIFNRLGLTTQMSNIIQIGANFDKKQLNRGKYTIRFIRQWTNITSGNIYFLQLLDSIRFIKSIPDTTIDQSFNRLAFLIGELSDKQIDIFTELALRYPPSTRSLTGALLEKLEYNNLAEKLLKSLKQTTNFNIDISAELIKDKKKWRI